METAPREGRRGPRLALIQAPEVGATDGHLSLANTLWRTRSYLLPEVRHLLIFGALSGFAMLLEVGAALVVIGFLLGTGLEYYLTWILQRVNQHLRLAMMDRAVHLPLRYHDDAPVGDAIYRVYQDSAMVTSIVQNALIQPLTWTRARWSRRGTTSPRCGCRTDATGRSSPASTGTPRMAEATRTEAMEAGPRYDDHIDVDSTMTARDVLRILRRCVAYIRPHWRLFGLKFGLMLGGFAPLLLVPWPVKILIDHVVLEHPLGDSAIRFPHPPVRAAPAVADDRAGRSADWRRHLPHHVRRPGRAGHLFRHHADARGLVREASVLILDEPTAALDPETERALVAALEEIKRDRIVFVIAHRLSTVARADVILFMEDGRIVEQGSHAELMDRPDGAYRRFVAS